LTSSKRVKQLMERESAGIRARLDPSENWPQRGKEFMPGTKSYLAEEMSNFFEAVWLDLPVEAAKFLFGAGDEKRFRKAGWKAYDAWIRLANEMTNALYANPLLGETSGRLIEATLRLRQIGGAMTSAFFGNFWPAVGLPTHTELVALREDLLALREELAAYAARLPVDDSAAAESQQGLRATGKASQINGFRPPNSPNIAPHPEGKHHAAA
jgi:hypothetical protein